MAITNHERVGKALELLKGGLAPFVEREFKNTYQTKAQGEATLLLGEDRLNAKKTIRFADHEWMERISQPKGTVVMMNSTDSKAPSAEGR